MARSLVRSALAMATLLVIADTAFAAVPTDLDARVEAAMRRIDRLRKRQPLAGTRHACHRRDRGKRLVVILRAPDAVELKRAAANETWGKKPVVTVFVTRL